MYLFYNILCEVLSCNSFKVKKFNSVPIILKDITGTNLLKLVALYKRIANPCSYCQVFCLRSPVDHLVLCIHFTGLSIRI